MICLKAYRVLKSANGKESIYVLNRCVTKWKNDFCDIDIFDPSAWKNYLANTFRLKDGKKLPNKSVDGDPIRYYVYVFGASKMMKEYFSLNGRGNIISLFPSNPNKGKLGLLKHGMIR